MMEETNGFATGYAVGRDSSNGGSNGNGMFGNDSWAWIVILLLFGYGRGFGGNGGGFGGFSGNIGCGSPCATQADVRAAVDQQTLISKLDNAVYGLTDSTYALNNTINQNFRNVDNAICTLGYQALQNTNSIQSQLAECCCKIDSGIERSTTQGIMNTAAIQKDLASCCCDLEKMNMQNRFDAQAYNCNTLQAIDALGDRLINHLNAKKTQALRDENMALRLAASQARQNEYLIERLNPNSCPVAAYVVQPPQPVTFATNCCGQTTFAGNAYGNGCGCGNGNF